MTSLLKDIKCFSEKIKHGDFFFLYTVFICFAFFIHLISLFLPRGISEAEEFYIYLLFFGLGPIAVSLIYKLTNRRADGEVSEISSVNQLLFFCNGYLVVLFCLVNLLSVLSPQNYPRFHVYAFSALQILLIVTLLMIKTLKPRVADLLYGPTIEIGNKALTFIAPWVLFVFFLIGYQKEIILVASSNLNFQIGLLIGSLAGVLIIILSKFSIPQAFFYKKTSKIISVFMLVLVVILMLSLFDPSLSSDPHHYNSYVGPAMAVLGGWIPSVDIHSHYGFLPFMLTALVFKHFVPPSYNGMAAVVSFFNVLQLLAVFLILHKMLKNKLLLYIGGIAFILFHKVLIPFNVNSLPSVTGFRHLPTFLLALALLYLPKGKKLSFFSLITLLFCSFWSIDQLVYGVVTYLFFLIGYGLASRESLFSHVKSVLMVLVAPLFAHAVFSIFMFLRFGLFPRYDLYFETLQRFAMGGFWAYPVNPDKLLFGFHLVFYSAVIVYGILTILGKNGLDRERKWNSVKYVLVITILGVLQMQYFVGRSSEIALMAYSLPLGVVFLALMDKVIGAKNFHFFKITGKIFLVPVLSLSTGLIMARFVIPATFSYSSGKGLTYEGSHLSVPAHTPNSTIFRKYLQKGVTLSDVFGDMKKKILHPSIVRSIGTNPNELTEAVELIKKWQPEEKRILLFLTGDLGVPALMYTNKAYKYPIGFGTADALFPKKTAKIINTPVDLKEGDILITDCPSGASLAYCLNGVVLRDNCAADRTGDWIQEGDSLVFDVDHYEFATSSDGKHFYRTDMKFRRGGLYKVSVDIRNGTASNKDFAVYVNDGATNLYSPPATTTNEWVTHTFSFKSKATTANGYAGIKILTSLNGNNIETRNFTCDEIMRDDAATDPKRSDWCTAEGLDPIQKEILEGIILRWDCSLVDESPSGVKVYRLKSKES